MRRRLGGYQQSFSLACGGIAHVHPLMYGTLRKEQKCHALKSIFAALLLAAIVGIVPQVHAQTIKVVIAGSSALWQTLALGAYNNGTSIVAGGGTTFHYTSGSNFNLVDNRPTTPKIDANAVWIVWDSAPTPNVLGIHQGGLGRWRPLLLRRSQMHSRHQRRYFSRRPEIRSRFGLIPPPIPFRLQRSQACSTLELLSVLPQRDIRPEDAAFATCRVNSIVEPPWLVELTATDLTDLATTQTTHPVNARFTPPMSRPTMRTALEARSSAVSLDTRPRMSPTF